MKYDLTKEEYKFIENYRDLLPEFQDTLCKHAQSLLELQTLIIRETLSQKQE